MSRAIQDARRLEAIEPENAITILKRAYGAVKSTIDAPIDLRQQLGKQLQGVIADVRAQKEVADQSKSICKSGSPSKSLKSDCKRSWPWKTRSWRT